jgi:CBS domain-containing protein
MKTARDILEPAVTVSADLPVRELAARLLDAGIDGACVVDGDTLLGVVTTMDLVFKEKQVHLPTMLYILDAVIPLGSARDVDAELHKMAGSTAGDLMTRKVISVGPDAGLDEVATRMVEDHLTLVPVVDAGRLLGVVTKRSLLRGSGLARARDATDG